MSFVNKAPKIQSFSPIFILEHSRVEFFLNFLRHSRHLCYCRRRDSAGHLHSGQQGKGKVKNAGWNRLIFKHDLGQKVLLAGRYCNIYDKIDEKVET
jgi:hypothetical protein